MSRPPTFVFKTECILDSRVRSIGDAFLADTKLPFFILECKDRKADGYEDEELEIYKRRLQRMAIGVFLADAPPAVSYLAVLGVPLFAEIVAVDKTVIVISLHFPGDAGPLSYLIYDAIALSLRMIPAPEKNPNWIYTVTSNVSIVRSSRPGGPYGLFLTGLLAGVDEGDCLYMWRPFSSSRPWSDKLESSRFLGDMTEIDMEISFNAYTYWVDLLRGFSFSRCDSLLFNYSSTIAFGILPLPVKDGGHLRNAQRMAQPAAYRTMGVVCDSFIRFVSIDGFQDYVELKKRTVAVWKLLGHGGWEKEHELSLETLWGFKGFGDVSKDLTPMYPLLSTKDTNVVYLVLGEYRENRFKFKFIPADARYLLAVDMHNKSVASVPLADWFPDPFVCCDMSMLQLHASV